MKLPFFPDFIVDGEWLLAGVVIGAVLGGVAVHHVMAPKAVREKPAAEVRQKDGSLVLARQTDQHAKPAQQIPKGAHLSRVVKLEIRPKDQACPPVHVDLSLVSEDNGSQRVIASSPDGTVVGGMDMPVARAIAAAKGHPWAAGASYGLRKHGIGVWAERDLWRLRFGSEIAIRHGEPEANVRVGLTF